MAIPLSYVAETIADNTVNQNTGAPTTSSWQVPVANLTAANLVAQSTLISNLFTAVAGVTIGNVLKSDITQSRNIVGFGPSSNVLAQRENKYLCRYHGATLNQKFQVSLPTADLSKLPTHSEFLDLTTGVGQALKIAFEAVVVSPDNSSEAVILDSVQFVGRNT